VAQQLAYVDTSAFLKLLFAEPESNALDAALEDWRWTCSVLLEVEATLAVRRRDSALLDATTALLGAVNLIELDADIRRAAAGLRDPGLRSLDAIHLATALSLGERCGAVFTYDQRLDAAARACRLRVEAPS
jgi:uncharacterized protein